MSDHYDHTRNLDNQIMQIQSEIEKNKDVLRD